MKGKGVNRISNRIIIQFSDFLFSTKILKFRNCRKVASVRNYFNLQYFGAHFNFTQFLDRTLLFKFFYDYRAGNMILVYFFTRIFFTYDFLLLRLDITSFCSLCLLISEREEILIAFTPFVWNNIFPIIRCLRSLEKLP